MNSDNPKPTCMHCGKFIADTSAPARFCSQACFDTLLGKVKSQWDQRFREAKANGNGAVRAVKPLSEIMQRVKARKPLSEMLQAKPKPELSLKRRTW
jgi:hypothetical protein